MADEKLRSLENVEKLVEMAARSSRFWRNIDRIVLPGKEFEALLERLVEEIPVDVKKAREMLSERDKLMEDAVAKSEKIVDDAVEEAGKLLDDSEIIRKAKRTAYSIREEADRYAVETLERLEDNVADILSIIKKAQSDLIAEMDRRRKEIQGDNP